MRSNRDGKERRLSRGCHQKMKSERRQQDPSSSLKDKRYIRENKEKGHTKGNISTASVLGHTRIYRSWNFGNFRARYTHR